MDKAFWNIHMNIGLDLELRGLEYDPETSSYLLSTIQYSNQVGQY